MDPLLSPGIWVATKPLLLPVKKLRALSVLSGSLGQALFAIAGLRLFVCLWVKSITAAPPNPENAGPFCQECKPAVPLWASVAGFCNGLLKDLDFQGACHPASRAFLAWASANALSPPLTGEPFSQGLPPSFQHLAF